MCCWSNSRLGDLWGQLENLQCRSLGIWGVVVKGEPLPVQNPPDRIAMRININVTISIGIVVSVAIASKRVRNHFHACLQLPRLAFKRLLKP